VNTLLKNPLLVWLAALVIFLADFLLTYINGAAHNLSLFKLDVLTNLGIEVLLAGLAAALVSFYPLPGRTYLERMAYVFPLLALLSATVFFIANRF
jgi:hypothetical protein